MTSYLYDDREISFPDDFKIEASPYISDTKPVRRSWGERLFTRPWHPLKRLKIVDSPIAYIIHSSNIVLVSYETYTKLKTR